MGVETQGGQPEQSGLGRRDLLRRGAMLTVATAWTVPVVQSLGPAALAADGSPRPSTGGGGQTGGVEGNGQQNGGGTSVLGEKFERGGSKLPRTGEDVAAMTAAAVALTAGGAAAYAAARKRNGAGEDAPRHAAS